MNTIRIHPNKATMSRIRVEARRHDTTEAALVMAIVNLVMTQDMLNAVLDGYKFNRGRAARNSNGWTDERVAILRAMAAEGKTAKQIAGALRGVTRSAVISKARRWGISLSKDRREKVSDDLT